MNYQRINDTQIILTGTILPVDMIKPGQVWEGSGGGRVTVERVENIPSTKLHLVHYRWVDNSGKINLHHKDPFNFQCRYCLVVDEQEKFPFSETQSPRA